jgi:hypothetical protein
MNQKVKQVLVVSAKNAVNAALMLTADVIHQPTLYNFHTREGRLGVLYSVAKAILAREAVIWGPKLLAWSSSA